MKKILLTLSVLLSVNTFSQVDCSGNRYYQQIFATVTKTANIQYGSNVGQDGTTPIDLFLDVYTPDGDMDNNRPLVILAHGGSFMGGSKSDMQGFCENLAKMGYVVSSIDYRLLTLNAEVFSNVGLAFKKEVVRSIHDMRAAIRFFRKSVAEQGNPYGINQDIIIVGGLSAGGIIGNHVVYFDDLAETPSELVTYVNGQGGLEGNSGNPGYSSDAQMTLSWCGAILDTTWMNSGDQPYVGLHNLDDQTVPNMAGEPNVGFAVPVTVHGDSLMYKRALNIGVDAAYKSYPGANHCDFPPSSFQFLTDFMHEQVCIQHLSLESNKEILYSIYPNPANESFFVDIPSNEWEWTVSVVNVLGQEVHRQAIHKSENRIAIQSAAFNSGIYFVNLISINGQKSVRKIMID